MKYLGYAFTLLLLGLLSAFTIYTLWGWFVVPLGVMKIGLAHAYGLSVFVGAFLGTRGIESGRKFEERVVETIICNVILLLFGYVVSIFM